MISDADKYTVRCNKCCIGKTETGQGIGAVVSEWAVSVTLEDGKSVPMARVGKCCNEACQAVNAVEISRESVRLGITEDMVRSILKGRNAMNYSLNEVTRGAPIKQGIKYNPNEQTEAGESII